MPPLVCYVTDRRALVGRTLAETIRAAIAAGVDWVQIREKDLPARELREAAREALAAAQATPARILVNDRLDVALAAGAHGVHLGRQSLPALEVNRWLRGRGAPRGVAAPPEFLVGVSCHLLEEAQQAERDGADYVFFGPVFATPSKAAFGPAQGRERLAQVCAAVRIPVLAIGGITVENAGQCLRAGAAGIAAIRLFQQAAGLAAVARALRA